MPTYPIATLKADRFGAFASLALDFSPELNVIVGDNGAGKSQLLKLLYACTASLSPAGSSELPTKTALGKELAEKLRGVFMPESLGRLANRQRGRSRAEILLKYRGLRDPLSFSFASNAQTEVKIGSVPKGVVADTPVFIPTRELMSIYPGFVSLFNERVLEFDETWRDTADLLGRPPLRGPRSEMARDVLEPIEDVLGGRVNEYNGRFYLSQPGLGNLEMHLVAEGLRKLSMIVRLVQSGTLLQQGFLFWDEPESNLNPATLRGVAQVIASLARSGVQVFVGTHSLFLLRELSLQFDEDDERAFTVVGLRRTDDGVVAQQAKSVDDLDLEFFASLQAEVEQTDRYLSRGLTGANEI